MPPNLLQREDLNSADFSNDFSLANGGVRIKTDAGSAVAAAIAAAAPTGAETKVTAGTNAAVTGSGTTASPYVVSVPAATDTLAGVAPLAVAANYPSPTNDTDAATPAYIAAAIAAAAPTGAETKVTAGTNAAVTGSGTTASPYVVSVPVATDTLAGVAPLAVAANYPSPTNDTDAATPAYIAAAIAAAAATGSETKINEGTNIFVTGSGTTAAPYVLNVPSASETILGVVELANVAETAAGTSTTLAVTPAGLAAFVDGAVDGSETKINSGTNISVTGSGTATTPYVLSVPNATNTSSGAVQLAVAANYPSPTNDTDAATPAYITAAIAAIPPADGSETKVTAGTNTTITGSGTTAAPYVVNVPVATDTLAGAVPLAVAANYPSPTNDTDAATPAYIAAAIAAIPATPDIVTTLALSGVNYVYTNEAAVQTVINPAQFSSSDAGNAIGVGTDGRLKVLIPAQLPDDQVLSGDNSGNVSIVLTPVVDPATGNTNYTILANLKTATTNPSGGTNPLVVGSSGWYIGLKDCAGNYHSLDAQIPTCAELNAKVPSGGTDGQVLTKQADGSNAWETPTTSAGGLLTVSHDATMTGDGTSGSPLSVVAATETVPGISELATTTEAAAGTSTTLAVTPAGLAAYVSTNVTGAETKVTAGTNVTVSGSGTTAAPYVVNVATGTDTVAGAVELATNTEAATGTSTTLAVTPAGLAAYVAANVTGAETKVTAGTNVTVTGSGTTASPYVLNVASASETVQGVVELATVAEAAAGTSTTLAVTPAGLKGAIDVAFVDKDGNAVPSGSCLLTCPANPGVVGQVLAIQSDGTLGWATPASGGSGLTTVSHDATMTGDGTSTSPLSVVSATDAVKGIVELATAAEATAGTSTTLAVTPAGLAAYVAANVTGAETKVTAGTNVTVTGSGTTASPYVINSSADGSETKVVAGTNITVTGSGTTASPYVINSVGGGTAIQATSTALGSVSLAVAAEYPAVIANDTEATTPAYVNAALTERHTAMGTATAINLSLGTYFSKTVSANTTFSVTNVKPANQVSKFTLALSVNGGNVTWPANTRWADGSPNISGDLDIFEFFTYDAGANWYATQIGRRYQ